MQSIIYRYRLRKRQQNNSKSGHSRKINQYARRVVITIIKQNPKINNIKIVEYLNNIDNNIDNNLDIDVFVSTINV